MCGHEWQSVSTEAPSRIACFRARFFAMDDALSIALKVAAAIESVGGQYFVGGSLASSLQGEPRSTNDIDMVVSIPIGKLEAFRGALGTDFEVDLDMLREAFAMRSCANIFYLPSVMKVDVFAVGRSDFDLSEFERKRAVPVLRSGETLFVKSVEDSIVRKLLWFRDGGEVSDRQWRDIVGLLRINGESLDQVYLERWIQALSLGPLFQRAKASTANR